jgi:hypothetical protein
MRRQLFHLVRFALLSLLIVLSLILGGCDTENGPIGGGGIQELVGGEGSEERDGEEVSEDGDSEDGDSEEGDSEEEDD